MRSEKERLVAPFVRRTLTPRRWRTRLPLADMLVRRLKVSRPVSAMRWGRLTTRPRTRKALPAVTAAGTPLIVDRRSFARLTFCAAAAASAGRAWAAGASASSTASTRLLTAARERADMSGPSPGTSAPTSGARRAGAGSIARFTGCQSGPVVRGHRQARKRSCAAIMMLATRLRRGEADARAHAGHAAVAGPRVRARGAALRRQARRHRHAARPRAHDLRRVGGADAQARGRARRAGDLRGRARGDLRLE